MKLGAMLGDIVGSLAKKPVTQQYPFVKTPGPARLRGKLVWDQTKCTGCQLCVKDCPSDAIEFIIIDKAAKRWVMRYNVDRCTYCAQCVVNCRFKCLSMSNEQWELASTDRDSFLNYYGKDTDVQQILAQTALGDTNPPGED
jgi:formate hydrogenlyase subunit 6/NADH:ubiquinone oxidoreductase subunit I